MRRASRIAQTGAYARSDLLIRTSDYNLLTVSQISLARDIPRDRYIDTDGERERERERVRRGSRGEEERVAIPRRFTRSPLLPLRATILLSLRLLLKQHAGKARNDQRALKAAPGSQATSDCRPDKFTPLRPA
jgi:hypothetical protein